MYAYLYMFICIVYGPTYYFFWKCRGGRESYLCFYCVVSIQIRFVFFLKGGGGKQGVLSMFLLCSEYTDKICIVVILRLNGKCGTITSVPVCPSF